MIAALWIIGVLTLVLLGCFGWEAWSLRNASGDAYIGEAALALMALIAGVLLALAWIALAYIHWGR